MPALKTTLGIDIFKLQNNTTWRCNILNLNQLIRCCGKSSIFSSTRQFAQLSGTVWTSLVEGFMRDISILAPVVILVGGVELLKGLMRNICVKL